MNIQGYSYWLFILLLWSFSRLVHTARNRQLLYLVASLLFYATWGVSALLILAFSAFFTYGCARLLRRYPRRIVFYLGVGANLAILIFFKSIHAFTSQIGISGFLSNQPGNIAIPIGISFWTFQALSYLIDSYRGKPFEATFLEFSLYMTFWPTVLAGPIHRARELIPQFRRVNPVNWEDISNGTRRVLIGLFMKAFLAQLISAGLRPGEGLLDGLNKIVGPQMSLGGLDVWFLAVGYGFLLYFDFAGYSNIAIGVARLFGIRLVENFDRPFCSKNPSEFWGRWHISLSTWIRDYIFLPLAVKHRSLRWRYLVVIFTMLLFGLWHGLSANFFLWGLYHGILLAIYHLIQVIRRPSQVSRFQKLGNIISWALTFALVSLGWIFFFSNDLSQVVGLLATIFSFQGYLHLELSKNYYLIIALVTASYFLVEGWRSIIPRLHSYSLLNRIINIFSPLYDTVILLLIILWNNPMTGFIYFQF